MNKVSIQYYKSPVGELILGSYEDKLCLSDWRFRKMRNAVDDRIQKGLNAIYVEEETAIIKKAINQFDEYFDGSRTTFDIPLKLVGTEFQQKVWETLITIKYGSTQSYLGLSKLLGNEKAIRAVASANGANAISIIVPCHRIIGKNSDLVGYAGGILAKKKLLQLEGSLSSMEQLQLF